LFASGDIPGRTGIAGLEQGTRQAVGNLVRTGEMALYGGAVPG